MRSELSLIHIYPNVCEIEICTNNDHAGRWAAEHIRTEYEGKYRVIMSPVSYTHLDVYKRQSRTVMRKTEITENPAFTFRTFLLRLGLIGPEYKNVREHRCV